MTQDLAHRRPWLLSSLFFGVTYPIAMWFDLPGIVTIAWKIAAIGFLVPYALRKHHSGHFWFIAIIMGLYALASGAIELSLRIGGTIFIVAHLVAIWLFSRYRRPKTVFSQNALAGAVLILTPLVAWLIASPSAAIYSLFLATMAAMAWTSSFSLYRVGIGAMLFVASDLLLFAREGGLLAQTPLIQPLIWYTLYIGVLLIAIGTVQNLVSKGQLSEE